MSYLFYYDYNNYDCNKMKDGEVIPHLCLY